MKQTLEPLPSSFWTNFLEFLTRFKDFICKHLNITYIIFAKDGDGSIDFKVNAFLKEVSNRNLLFFMFSIFLLFILGIYDRD